MEWRSRCKVGGAVPLAAMMVVECVEVGLTVLSKAAMKSGMSNFVFVVYYNALASLFLLPYFLSQFLRSNRHPKITFSLLYRFFMLGLIGICVLQVCAFKGINYSSPTLAAACGNLIPAFTFLLAIILKMEKLDLRKGTSQAKALGTLVAISGASTATLYKGPTVLMAPSSADFTSSSSQQLLSPYSNWVLGGLLLGVASLCSSIWNIFQAATTKEFPHEVIIVFFYTLFGTIQTTIVSLILERNPRAWKFHHQIEIVAVIYAAVAVSIFRNTVVTWCLRERGPVYVAMFKPLSIVIAAIMGFFFLGDTLYLGSVIGSVAIAAGFYAVIWGQARERTDVSISDQTKPLLHSSVDL